MAEATSRPGTAPATSAPGRRGWRELRPLERLKRYEAGWRWRGVLADPSEEELAYVRALVRTYGSVLRP
jgi:hypothetical protein